MKSFMKIYRFSLCLLKFCLIFDTYKLLHRSKSNKTFAVLNAFLSIFIVIFNLTVAVYSAYFGDILLISNIIKYFILLTNYSAFCLSFRKIQRLQKLFYNANIIQKRSTVILLYVWGIVVLSIELLYLITLLTFAENLLTPLKVEIVFFKVLHFFSSTLNLKFPMTIFPVLYVVICCTLLRSLTDFKKSLTHSKEVNYTDFLNRYLFIKESVKIADNVLSLFVLTSTMYNGVLMYQMVVCLKNKTYDTFLALFIMTSLTVNTIGNIIMNFSAASIEESSKDIVDILYRLPSKDQDNSQKKLISCCQNGISLTMWKIFPIQRSLIIGIYGTILTYILLIDGSRV